MSELDIRKADLEKFISSASAPCEITTTPEGFSVAAIDGDLIPVASTDFSVSVIQPGSITDNPSMKPHKGKFYINNFDESTDVLRLVPITIVSRGRQYFEGQYKNKDDKGELICYSSNGVFPNDRAKSKINHVCAEESVGAKGFTFLKEVCPYATWGSEGKPKCSYTITAAFLDIDRKCPVVFQFKGTSVSVFNAFQREYAKQKDVAMFKGRSIYDQYIEMTLDDKGTYFALMMNLKHDPELKPSKFLPLCSHYLLSLYAERKAQEQTQEYKAPADESNTLEDDVVLGETVTTSTDAQAFTIN